MENGAIRWAAQNGHLEVVKLLLADSRVNPAALNNKAIQWAAEEGQTEVVKVLLADSRVDPAANNSRIIGKAAKNYHSAVVKLLLADSRVDWRVIPSNLREQLIKEQENELKKELTVSYLSLERSSPQVTFERKIKSAIPKEILRKTTYLGQYQEL